MSCISVSSFKLIYISVTAATNFFNLGKMMSYYLGLMPNWFHFSDDHDELSFYSTVYNIAVVNMVFKYLLISPLIIKFLKLGNVF